MTDEGLYPGLKYIRQGLYVVWGIAIALLVTTVAGDTTNALFEPPLGWILLWLVTTLGSIPMGAVLLLGWPAAAPMHMRRRLGMSYLLVGFSNLLALTFYVQEVVPGLPAFTCPVTFAVILVIVYIRYFAGQGEEREDLFP